MCAIPNESYAFISLATAVNTTVTHEIGHAFGGEHIDADNCGPGVGTIMCGFAEQGTFSVSNDNRETIENHISGTNCLENPQVNTTFETTDLVWNQVTTDDFNWTRDTGGTPSNQTGPSSAYQGNWYFYTEATNNFNSTAQIVSQPYHVCTSNLFLSFGYHMFGTTMGNLSVQISDDSGVTWTNEWTRAGDNGDAWLTGVVGLSPYAGQTILIRFTGVTGSSFRSDMAIDDIEVGTICPLTVTPNFIEFPQSGGSQSFTVIGSASWEAHRPAFGNWANLNPSGNIVTVTAVANPSSNGRMVPVYVSCGPSIYTVTVVQAGIPVDPPPQCSAPFTSLPHIESFETEASLWTQDQNDDFDWTLMSGSTPSSGTGPTGADDGNRYMYTEATNNFNQVANLISPCFDLSNVLSPTFNFSFHMWASFSDHMGVLNLQVSTNNGVSWNTIWTETGGHGQQWIPQSVDLSDFTNQPIRLRFNGTTGSGFKSDMAIDNFNLTSGNCSDPFEINNDFASAHSSTMGNSIQFSDACLFEGDKDYFQLIRFSGFQNINFFVKVKGGNSNSTGAYSLTLTITEGSLIVETIPSNGSTTNTHITVYDNAESGAIAQDNNSGQGNFSKLTIPLTYFSGLNGRMAAPADFELANFPNPFNQTTTFTFSLETESNVNLSITDLSGKVIAMPINNVEYTEGNHQLAFDASTLAAGVYTYTLKTKDGLKSKQMVIVR